MQAVEFEVEIWVIECEGLLVTDGVEIYDHGGGRRRRELTI